MKFKKHNEMIAEIANRCINAGYQTRSSFILKTKTQINGEIDLLAISIDDKILGLVEVKTHYSVKNYNKARKQIKKEEILLRNRYGFKPYDMAKFYYSNEFQEAYGNARARKALERIVLKELN